MNAFVIVLPETDDLHGVLPVQHPQSLLLVDMQVLIGVVIVHVEGDLKLHPSHGVNQAADGLPLHHNIEVRVDAGEAADLFFQGGHTLFEPLVLTQRFVPPVAVEDSVQPLLPSALSGGIHHRIPQ